MAPGAPVLSRSVVDGGAGFSNIATLPTNPISWVAGDGIVVIADFNLFSGTPVIAGTGLTFNTAYSAAPGNTHRIWTAVAAAIGTNVTLVIDGFSADAWAYQVHRIRVTNGVLSYGTVQASVTTNAAGITLTGLTGFDANDYQLAFTVIAQDALAGTYAGLTATPRALWPEIQENLGDQPSQLWGGFVHSQISPIGGEGTVSVTDLDPDGRYRMLVLPLVVT